MKNYLFFVFLFSMVTVHASEEQITVVALPFHEGFTQKPTMANTGAAIIADAWSFGAELGGWWNGAYLIRNSAALSEIGREASKKVVGCSNILRYIAEQAKKKELGEMSSGLQDCVVKAVIRQPLTPDVKTLLYELKHKNVGVVGWSDQDSREHGFYREYLKSDHGIDVSEECSRGTVVCPYHQEISEFYSGQQYLQKDGITIANKPFPSQSFLAALNHHAQGKSMLVAKPLSVSFPEPGDSPSGLKVVPFQTVAEFTKLLRERSVIR